MTLATKFAMEESRVANNELVFTRLFDAPRKMVWAAWTEPKQVACWWGPEGFTTTIEKMDLQVGGEWKLVLHGPDGTDYPNRSRFTALVPMERIAFRNAGSKAGGPAVAFDMDVHFEDEGYGKTRVTMRLVFVSAEALHENVRAYNSVEGGKQTLQRLAGFLSERA